MLHEVRWLDSLVITTRGQGSDRGSCSSQDVDLQFRTGQLIHALLLSRRLKDPSLLADTIDRALQLLPQSLRAIGRSCIKEGWLTLPSRSALFRAQLAFDAALMMWRRQEFDDDSGDAPIRYGFADASPQGKRNWLIMRLQTVRESQVLAVVDATYRLASDAASRYGQGDDYPLLEDADSAVNRIELAEIIFENVRTQTLPPVALGLGKSSVVDKCASFLYAVFLEAGWSRLANVLDSICSFTTDMGAELGMNEFANVNFDSLLPQYLPYLFKLYIQNPAC